MCLTPNAARCEVEITRCSPTPRSPSKLSLASPSATHNLPAYRLESLSFSFGDRRARHYAIGHSVVSISSKLPDLFVAQTLDVLLSEILNAVTFCFCLSSPKPDVGFLRGVSLGSGFCRLCRSRWPRPSVINDALRMRSGNRIGAIMLFRRRRRRGRPVVDWVVVWWWRREVIHFRWREHAA